MIGVQSRARKLVMGDINIIANMSERVNNNLQLFYIYISRSLFAISKFSKAKKAQNLILMTYVYMYIFEVRKNSMIKIVNF